MNKKVRCNVIVRLCLCIGLLLGTTISLELNEVNARRMGGGFRSGVKSFKPTPRKAVEDHGLRSSTKSNSGSGASPLKKPGFFNGGSFMRGLMLGGLAGMLFGSLFPHGGFLGNLMGLALNLLAGYIILLAVMGLYRAFKNRRNSVN